MKRLVPLLLLAAACSGPPPAPEASGDKPAKAPTVEKKPAGPTIAPPRAFDESLLTGRENLLETPGKGQVLDYGLGELSTDALVVAAVKAFLADTIDGKLDPEALAPRWADYLQDWAMQHPVKGEVRVGMSREQEGQVLVPFRTTDGTVQGWVVLEHSGKAYLISDAHAEALEPRAAPFDPESPQP